MLLPPSTLNARQLDSTSRGLITRGAVVAVLSLVMTYGLAGCADTDDEPPAASPTPSEESSIADGYFGSVQIAQGSSLDMVVDRVDSSAEVRVLDAPGGLRISLTDDDEGIPHIEIEAANDAATGVHVVTFDIDGEPETVNWTIEILAR